VPLLARGLRAGMRPEASKQRHFPIMKVELPTLPASPLPPLYAAWMEEFLAGSIPQESNATCSDCAMCSPEHPDGSDDFFSWHTKCCTYQPALPNYLVGRILADADPQSAAGRATVESRFQAGAGVTPLGLGQSRVFDLLYRQSPRAFGRNRRLRCPHYLEDGRCGVWKHRAAVCATWFCKHVRGSVGARFWQSLHQLLAAVEKSLASWCVLELDIGVEALGLLFPPPQLPDKKPGFDGRTLDGTVDPAAYRRVWGNWCGREAEFYQECAQRVNALPWRDVLAIGGSSVAVFVRVADAAYRKLLSNELPEPLKLGAIQVSDLAADSACVAALDGGEALKMPRELHDLLGHFDGRPIRQVLDAIEAETGLVLEEALVRKLADYEILVPVETAGK
jgi:hypothetical protein